MLWEILLYLVPPVCFWIPVRPYPRPPPDSWEGDVKTEETAPDWTAYGSGV